MNQPTATDDELLAWLDEQLPPARMVEIETTLRDSESLRRRIGALVHHRDRGVHSVGEIWRRGRLSCPTRKELGGYLLDALPDAQVRYVEFHVQTVGCRVCAANLEDLQNAARDKPQAQQRRRRIFQSSAGRLRSQGD
ncbi:MAG: hypothetical protein CMJ48_14855 [Planctomycetaceae bacterium]|nr:hypothetical protein [Planctomycetaceae bacterium]